MKRPRPENHEPTPSVCKIVGEYEGIGDVVLPVRRYTQPMTRDAIEDNLRRYPIEGLGKERTNG